MELNVEPLDPQAFSDYGMVLRRDPSGAPFQPLHTDAASEGWRVAMLAVTPGPLRRLHRHPDSEECFVPLEGAAFIAVSTTPDPAAARLFQLTEPVCIQRGIWHEVVSAAPASVFIAENAIISGEAHAVEPPISLNLAAP